MIEIAHVQTEPRYKIMIDKEGVFYYLFNSRLDVLFDTGESCSPDEFLDYQFIQANYRILPLIDVNLYIEA